MISIAEFESLVKENGSLKVRLEELELILQQREEELALLHRKNEEVIHQKLEEETRAAESAQLKEKLSEAERRQEAERLYRMDLERESIAAIGIENEYYRVLENFKGLEARSALMQTELEETWKISAELIRLKQQLQEIQSRLELSELDRDIFKEDLEACRSEKIIEGDLAARED
jgi:hypothetical protein